MNSSHIHCMAFLLSLLFKCRQIRYDIMEDHSFLGHSYDSPSIMWQDWESARVVVVSIYTCPTMSLRWRRLCSPFINALSGNLGKPNCCHKWECGSFCLPTPRKRSKSSNRNENRCVMANNRFVCAVPAGELAAKEIWNTTCDAIRYIWHIQYISHIYRTNIEYISK